VAYVLRVLRLGLPLVDVSAGALAEAALFLAIVGLAYTQWESMLGNCFLARWESMGGPLPGRRLIKQMTTQVGPQHN
jgi:hypothetical protein